MATEMLDAMPILPLRDVVVYPHMVIPLFVGRDKSIRALDAAMSLGQKQVLLVAQKNATQDEPERPDLYEIGTVATILQLLKLPDGTVKVLVEGVFRAKITHYEHVEPYFLVKAQKLASPKMEEQQSQVLTRAVLTQFEKYIKLNRKIPAEIVSSVSAITDPERLADTIAAHIALKIADKQTLLEEFDIARRLEHLMLLMETEIDLLQVEARVYSNIKKNMEKNQREYYLNEKIKAIQEELGQNGQETDEMIKRIENAGMPKDVVEKAQKELARLKRMPPMSAEATVLETYLRTLLEMPWKTRSKAHYDLPTAQKILDEDHYGLEQVKDRIMEYLAIQKRVRKLKGPILCLVGPPGVGKTSLGQSIARATNRKFVRVALGGVRDEAEIRGHRRTYIGSMPGKILQKIAKVGVKNPLFLLDEIDKMASDFRGDPASALLEVLDPEQNSTFNDHYLEVDYDLSEVMFVATANTMNIPPALLDRMEVIRLSGYTEDEKLAITQNYLVPKQFEANGVREGELKITPEAIIHMIRYYTREAGVRNLDREMAKLCRKIVKEVLMKEIEADAAATKKVAKKHVVETPIVIDAAKIEQYLGVRKYHYGKVQESDRIGQIIGLAWTEVGGEILTLEAASVPGKGVIIRTGHLGEVMQESIQAAVTVVRSRAASLGIKSEVFEKNDIHVHVPEGATPKDGPSAGIGMCCAIVSALTGIPARSDVAMTGEITLRGEVLPIGGLKEKLLAARRSGITDVIIPSENQADLKEIPENILSNLTIHCVKWIDEVLELALVSLPIPLEPEVIAPIVAEKVTKKQTLEEKRH